MLPGKHRVRISIIYYFILNPINPTLQPAVSAVNNLDQPITCQYPIFLEPTIGISIFGTRMNTDYQDKKFVFAFEIIPNGKESAENFGMLKASLEKSGSRLDDFDLIIASCALAHNLTLVTNNLKHFSRMKGLKITNWSIYPEKNNRLE